MRCRGVEGGAVALLPFCGEGPPGLRLVAGEEAGHRHEHVEHTGILPGAGHAAEGEVELVGVRARELRRGRPSHPYKVAGHSGADIGEVGKVRQVGAVDFAGMHGRRGSNQGGNAWCAVWYWFTVMLQGRG